MGFMSAFTNKSVGEEVGVSHATISRIRSGDRLPSMRVIMAICDKYGWPIDEQVRLQTASTSDNTLYADRFEEVLYAYYAKQAAAS